MFVRVDLNKIKELNYDVFKIVNQLFKITKVTVEKCYYDGNETFDFDLLVKPRISVRLRIDKLFDDTLVYGGLNYGSSRGEVTYIYGLNKLGDIFKTQNLLFLFLFFRCLDRFGYDKLAGMFPEFKAYIKKNFVGILEVNNNVYFVNDKDELYGVWIEPKHIEDYSVRRKLDAIIQYTGCHKDEILKNYGGTYRDA